MKNGKGDKQRVRWSKEFEDNYKKIFKKKDSKMKDKPRYDKITGEEVKPINSYLTTDLDVKVDKCVMCGTKTEYTKDTHIDNREYYVEGAGQMCKHCHTKIY
jgi:hypothetical protein